MIDIRSLSDLALLNALTLQTIATILNKSTQTAWRLRTGLQALTVHQRAELETCILADDNGVLLRAAQVWDDRQKGKPE